MRIRELLHECVGVLKKRTIIVICVYMSTTPDEQFYFVRYQDQTVTCK